MHRAVNDLQLVPLSRNQKPARKYRRMILNVCSVECRAHVDEPLRTGDGVHDALPNRISDRRWLQLDGMTKCTVKAFQYGCLVLLQELGSEQIEIVAIIERVGAIMERQRLRCDTCLLDDHGSLLLLSERKR